MANPGDSPTPSSSRPTSSASWANTSSCARAGAQNYPGLCPFHGEKTPSFSVHATRQFFHCFGCGASGDVFTFVQKIENITFPEAVRAVAQKLGIPLPKASSARRKRPARPACAASCSTSTSAPAPGSSSSCAVPRRRRPRVSCRARTRRRSRSPLPHRLRARVRLPAARRTPAPSRRRALRERACSPGRRNQRIDQGRRLGIRASMTNNGSPPAPAQPAIQPQPPSTPSSATASCFPSPTSPARSSPSPDAPSHRRQIRPQVSQLAGDAHLLQVARAVQPRQRQGGHPQAGLRHPGRGPDGLHFRLQRRIPQRDCRSGTAFTELQARCSAASAKTSW